MVAEDIGTKVLAWESAWTEKRETKAPDRTSQPQHCRHLGLHNSVVGRPCAL